MAEKEPQATFAVITSLRYESRRYPNTDSPFQLVCMSFKLSNMNQSHLGTASSASLSTHLDRLLESAKAAGWVSAAAPDRTSAEEVDRVNGNIRNAILDVDHEAFISPKSWRVRLDRLASGHLTITAAPVAPLPTYRQDFNPFCPSRLPDPSQIAAWEVDGSLLPKWRVVLHAKKTARGWFCTTWKTSDRGVYEDARDGVDAGTEVVLQNESGTVMDGTLSSVYFWRGGQWVTPSERCGPLKSISRQWALQSGLAIESEIRVASIPKREAIWLANGVRGFSWGWLEGQVVKIG